ncbi:Putative SUI1 domain, PUA-like superfamily, SUI1 domain superfamily, SWIB/MDM2 domain superfamily [Septoria linicola]|uniref:SUI1 domain, PUA-like superfamily, SUI1 domain superfamily, SWIB/MDM2 domain superfamily n=1 Tax=Septoria linicola TaxID=215465 RepID=A0A9Q9EFG0_9PEZI|nr:putative SUI1 domain, PUA-like superfamily, SUI1 domain superfamily, SWIB/MDM2 domain superfamily [Septoria linicola]USW49726.1 Putative SUI1 domain, PUA-like superfamily, SUI1 domain superfamily, SWIB/MDM2 domain superfamily [Septoria linicola]
MFKKKPIMKPQAPMRSSDRRKLADQIIKDFELDRPEQAANEQTPEQKAEAAAAHSALRNSLLPENTQSTTFKRSESQQGSGTLYVGNQDGEDSRILWFQVEGQMIPSVYTLWRHPGIVPLLHTPEIVVKKLQGGADLMIPGLFGGPPFPPRAKKGAVVAIAALERPTVPVAVGVCEIDVGALEKVRGEKGKAVENMHWLGDELWNHGHLQKPGQQPPEEIEGWSKVLQDRGLLERVADLELEDHDEAGGVSLENGDAETSAESSKAPSNGNALAETVEAKELSQKEIDEAFRNAFLFGVNHYKTSNPSAKNYGLDFPLTQTVIMSTLVQPFLPAYSPEQAQQLQIKKTSWKNIKKFVKSLDKAKIVKSKDKDGNETTIIDIDFDDVSITTFKPYRLPKKETAGGTSLGRGEAGNVKIDTADDSVGQKLSVMSSYKPSSKLQPIFDAASGTKSIYTPPEVRDLVTIYLEKENLISETNKRLAKLNAMLANAVFDGSGSLDKEVLAKGTVPRDALIDRILHAMSPQYSIVRQGTDPGNVKAKSGAAPKVHITLETRSGNKTVTKVSGLEAYHINARPLADELRKVCAGSTSVEPLAGAAKKNEKEVLEVMVQGPQKDAVVKALERRGVDKRWVEVLDKTKGKKR